MLFSYDHIAYIACYQTPQLHRHFAKHIMISLGGALEGRIEGDIVTCEGIGIQSGAEHTVCSRKGELLLYLYDETCDAAELLNERYLKGREYAVLEPELCEKIRTLVKTQTLTGETDRLIIQELHLAARKDTDAHGKYDDRITEVLDYIHASESLQVGSIIKELCSVACLSESRLSHLFRENMGISLAGYLTFVKVAKTYEYVLLGESITEAAIHAGFSSSAHFAAVNKKNFGISARELENTFPFVQIAEN